MDTITNNIPEIYLAANGFFRLLNGALANREPRRPLLTLIDGMIMLLISAGYYQS